MKKLLSTMFMCLLTMALVTSCGSSNTPAGVAEKAAKCLKSKDYKGFAKLVDMPDEEKGELVSLLEEKASEELESKGGIKSYEIVNEDVDEESGTATVRIKYVYGNGDEQTDPMNLVKSKSGDWKLSTSK